jgi:hypothetical protein
MIQIKVNAGKNHEALVHSLCETLRHARIWTVKDRRCTQHLVLQHTSGTVKGTIKRVGSHDPDLLEFECKAKDRNQEAITAGRFVNLVLRDLASVSELSVVRR